MARLRRERDWRVNGTVVEARDAVARYLSERGLNVTNQDDHAVEAEGGSALKALFLWKDGTAPYRVRVELWDDDAGVKVEAVFEERFQAGKFGPVKRTTYTKLADRFLAELRAGTSPVS